MTMRIAIYSRVSTDKQDNVNQLVQLREFAKKQKWTVVHEYVDVESGSKADRKEFLAMFNDASKRRFDLVLFWALDRLSREGVLETLQHLNRLESYGVAYRSFTESYFDSCGVFRDVIISVAATLAKQERIRRSERTRAGLAIARAKGKVLGRPRCDVDLAAIRRLRAKGTSWRKIGRALGVSHATCLQRARLKNIG
jgi:DNA invertase Pin-like site-specific DNA recombinase